MIIKSLVDPVCPLAHHYVRPRIERKSMEVSEKRVRNSLSNKVTPLFHLHCSRLEFEHSLEGKCRFNAVATLSRCRYTDRVVRAQGCSVTSQYSLLHPPPRRGYFAGSSCVGFHFTYLVLNFRGEAVGVKITSFPFSISSRKTRAVCVAGLSHLSLNNDVLTPMKKVE